MIRAFKAQDIQEVLAIFYESVHSIPDTLYTKAQRHAWAPETVMHDGHEIWQTRMLQNYTFVYVLNDKIIGFIEMTATGYIDTCYVHPQHQKQQIGQQLYNKVEQLAQSLAITQLSTHASAAAKEFFIKNNFIIEKKQTVIRHDVTLYNFVMSKQLTY